MSGRLAMATKIGASIFTLAVLMQTSDHFSIQCDALRMISLDAPQMAIQGETIQLSCSYSLITIPNPTPRDNNGAERRSGTKPTTNDASGRKSRDSLPELEAIYAIKWYKDEREFFRYLTQDWPHKQAFPVEGLNIDVDKSDNQTVVLRNVTLRTSGAFKCEVSTDAPSFLTKSIERKLFVHHLPNEGPIIEQLNKQTGGRPLYLGDQLSFRCSSEESKPATQIDWIINETLNLTNAKSLQYDFKGVPLFHVITRRMIRLPVSSSAVSQTKTTFKSSAHWIESGGQKSVYMIETMADKRQGVVDSGVSKVLIGNHQQVDLNLSSPSGILASRLVLLATDSLHQVAETSISWLNFTVDSNLLQYLHKLGELSEKSFLEEMRTVRKISATSTNSAPSTNQTSRGNVFTKIRRKTNSSPELQQRRLALARDQSDQMALNVRCVARVMHLSLSDDIKLKIVNGTRDQALGRILDSNARKDKIAQAANSGSSEWSRLNWASNAVNLFVLILTLSQILTKWQSQSSSLAGSLIE